MILIIQYLLAGLIISFLLEHVIRGVGHNVSHGERISMIILWPIMVVVFIYNFIKGFLGKN